MVAPADDDILVVTKKKDGPAGVFVVLAGKPDGSAITFDATVFGCLTLIEGIDPFVYHSTLE